MVKIEIEDKDFEKLKMLKDFSDIECSFSEMVGAMIDVVFDDTKRYVRL